MHDYGFRVVKNDKIAFDYYLKSATNGWSFAQTMVGTKCDNRQDKETAIEWYQRINDQKAKL